MSIALYLLIALGLFVLTVPLVNAAITHSERLAERRRRSRERMDGASCH